MLHNQVIIDATQHGFGTEQGAMEQGIFVENDAGDRFFDEVQAEAGAVGIKKSWSRSELDQFTICVVEL